MTMSEIQVSSEEQQKIADPPIPSATLLPAAQTTEASTGILPNKVNSTGDEQNRKEQSRDSDFQKSQSRKRRRSSSGKTPMVIDEKSSPRVELYLRPQTANTAGQSCKNRKKGEPLFKVAQMSVSDISKITNDSAGTLHLPTRSFGGIPLQVLPPGDRRAYIFTSSHEKHYRGETMSPRQSLDATP